MANTDETPVFSRMSTNIAVGAKRSLAVLIYTMGHEETVNCHESFSSG
jgi:hypothetical protein